LAEGYLVLASEGKSDFAIELPPDADPVAQFAAEELQTYLERLCGVRLPIVDKAAGPVLRLVEEAPAAPLDSNSIVVEEAAITLKGRGSQGLLKAAYRLLEWAGCRFILPGPEGEFVPRLEAIHLALGASEEVPLFPLRGLWEGTDYVPLDKPVEVRNYVESERRWLDWMGKRGLNQFFSARSPELAAQLDGEMAKRGIHHEIGGHLIPTFLPRELFEAHPEYFRMDETGQRTPTGNFCVSNAEALRIVANAACEYARQFPRARMLHLWGEDVMAGSWCKCPDCASLSPQEQYLRVVNAVAEALESAGLHLAVDYLAYHDTLEPDFESQPSERVLLAFAPRERSYATGLGNTYDKTNLPYYKALEGLMTPFEGRTYAMEYYADAILFSSLMMPLVSVIADDFELYRRLGSTGVSTLMFGDYCAAAYGLNLYAASRYAWDLNLSPERVIREYVKGLYDEATEALELFYFTLERAMAFLAAHHDVRLPRFEDVASGESLVADLEQALALLAEARSFLEKVLANRPVRGHKHLAAEVTCFRLTHYLVQAIYHHSKALVLKLKLEGEEASAARESFRARALAELQDAVKLHGEVLALLRKVPPAQKGLWGQYGLPNSEATVLKQLEAEVHALVPGLEEG